MYFPNREAIFEDIDPNDTCSNISCSYLHYKSIGGEPQCGACHHSQCGKVELVASTVNMFIEQNDDMFMYINCDGKEIIR